MFRVENHNVPVPGWLLLLLKELRNIVGIYGDKESSETEREYFLKAPVFSRFFRKARVESVYKSEMNVQIFTIKTNS